MTVPLPDPGDQDWVDYAEWLNTAATEVRSGRLSEGAIFASEDFQAAVDARIGESPGPGITEVELADLPDGSTFVVKKNDDGTWPDRPTNRPKLMGIWKGPDPGPAVVVPPSVSGMYDDSGDAIGDIHIVTP